MSAPPEPILRFLWHPGESDRFSGYGLALGPRHLVGLLMVDRPDPADPQWLTTIEQAFGGYELAAMTQTGERGILCQMRITPDSTRHLRSLPTYPRAQAIRQALLPLLRGLPAVTLSLSWSPGHRAWLSQIVHRTMPLFPLGRLVATSGALEALERAGQPPMEFLDRHVHGDWGEVPDEDKLENVFSLEHSFRILSAYTTSAGDKIWILTEANRSATTILLPDGCSSYTDDRSFICLC